MEGIFPFQRLSSSAGNAVSITTTTSISTAVTFQITGATVVEVANLSTTASAAFVLSDATVTTVPTATTAMRTVPPATVVTEYMRQGTSFAAAIAVSGSPTLVFTPGVING